MRKQVHDTMLATAKHKSGHAGEIVNAATRAGTVELTAIEKEIATRGFLIRYVPRTNGRFDCYIDDPSWKDAEGNCAVVAYGMSNSKDDALLHAMHGWVREDHAAKQVDDAVAAKGVKIDAAVRAKLVSRFIEGGHAQLAKDMTAFDAK